MISMDAILSEYGYILISVGTRVSLNDIYGCNAKSIWVYTKKC
jgi:hypothetical protein